MIKTVSKCLWCESKDLSIFTHRKDGVRILSCGKCGLYMVGEIPEDLDEYYYQETYYNASETNVDTGYAEIYDLMAPAFLLWQNSLIEEVNEKHLKKNLLEIGCATGNLLEIVRESQKHLSLEGIDISEYAARAAREKGFNAHVAYIEKYVAKPPKDIIFSAETMEHLDDLKSFLEGVKNNLKDNGTYLFYVPSISVEDAEKDKDHYVRFNTNLEHLLHFTPEFFNNELPKFFDADVLIKEFKTGFGPCIVGAVSKDASNLSDLKEMFKALETEVIPRSATPTFLKNLIIMALKFAQFELADKALVKLEATGEVDATTTFLLEGLKGYHNGQLAKSNKAFEEYLKASPGSMLPIKSLLSNEREMNRLMLNELHSLKQEALELVAKANLAKEELKNLKQSRLVNTALKVRHLRRGIVGRAPKAKKKIRNAARRVVLRVVPRSIRVPVKYALSREWMVKHIWIDNQKLKKGQPILSIVIPYYNRADTIGETLDSLRAQTFQDFEVIIVDDGSAEGQDIHTVDKKYLNDLRITIVEQKNQGVATARNNGIKKSRGKYVMCLDSDDLIDPTYVEKFLVVLETHPDIDLVGSDMRHFGVNNFVYKEGVYDPFLLRDNNMLITSTMFKREAWEKTGGYKSHIGYEDWEFWINLAEYGYWGMNIPEPLLNYRTAASSRYIEDQSMHAENVKRIRDLHPHFMKYVRRVYDEKRFNRQHVTPETLFINLDNPAAYKGPDNDNQNVLITIPWMTFGGAETLIYNFCKEIKDKYNISFITGLQSEHEWEYMFKELSRNIYHLPHFTDDRAFYVEFISHYIKTRNIDILHVIHNGFTFEMLEELKKRHPRLKVIVTLFNDRTEYFAQTIEAQKYIDVFATDNQAVATHFSKELDTGRSISVIPNGIDCYNTFKRDETDRKKERAVLGVDDEDMAIFFVGRLSVEKNPDVFVEVARTVLNVKKLPNVRFFIIGDGPMRLDIEKTIKDIGSDRIQYLGYQPPQDVAKYLNAADVFVLPSSTEGFPLSLLEAMAMNLVPVASHVGAVPDVLVEGVDGFIISPPGSAEGIVKVITKLHGDQKLVEAIKHSARKKVEEKYSSKKLGDNYVDMYKSTLSS